MADRNGACLRYHDTLLHLNFFLRRHRNTDGVVYRSRLRNLVNHRHVVSLLFSNLVVLGYGVLARIGRRNHHCDLTLTRFSRHGCDRNSARARLWRQLADLNRAHALFRGVADSLLLTNARFLSALLHRDLTNLRFLTQLSHGDGPRPRFRPAFLDGCRPHLCFRSVFGHCDWPRLSFCTALRDAVRVRLLYTLRCVSRDGNLLFNHAGNPHAFAD